MRRVGRFLGGALLALALIVPLGYGQSDPPAEDETAQAAPSPSDPQPLEYEMWKTANGPVLMTAGTQGQKPAADVS